MERLPKCEELEKADGGSNWLDTMIVYFDEYAYDQREFTCWVNRLIGKTVPTKAAAFLEEMMNKEGTIWWKLDDVQREAEEKVHEIEFFVGKLMRDARDGDKGAIVKLCGYGESFIGELDMLAYKFVRRKMGEFMKETHGKDIMNLMKLQILGREFELRAREKSLFIEKLKGNMNY
nr:hypothetical protein [Tanacetum cinerariifolium]